MNIADRRNDLLSYISDAHKDAYGFRPRGMGYNEMSLAELEAEADRLSDAVCDAIEAEEAAYKAAAASFEAEVALMLSHGAGSRLNAIKWMLDSRDLLDYANFASGYIDDYVNFSLGLSYRYDLLKGEDKY